MIKEFQLGAKDYRVDEVDQISGNIYGLCTISNGLIEIANSVSNMQVPEDSKDQTFYHELIHCILDDLGYTDLSGNETFVQSFACLLHQFEKTKK